MFIRVRGFVKALKPEAQARRRFASLAGAAQAAY
jgi:hypothetical protein